VLNGPLHAARQQWGRQPSDDELPRLRKLSDVFWGYWIRDNPNVSNLRYLWMMDVENVDTQKIVTQALHNVGKEIEKWPGVTFDMTTDEGKAILGKKNARPCSGLAANPAQLLKTEALLHGYSYSTSNSWASSGSQKSWCSWTT